MPDEKLARVHLELAKGYEFVATFPDLPNAGEMTFDETPPLGTGTGPSPALLLAATIGNCLAASLVFCMRKARVPAPKLGVDVAARLVRNAAGRFRIGAVDVVLSPETSEETIAGLARCANLFEDFCTVTESVRHGIPVNVSLEASPSARRHAESA